MVAFVGAKARVFNAAGYSRRSWQMLASDLVRALELSASATGVPFRDGVKFVVPPEFTGPRGRTLRILTVDHPGERLRAGDIGTVVYVYDAGEVEVEVEVEFLTVGGDTRALVRLPTAQLRLASASDVRTARSV